MGGIAGQAARDNDYITAKINAIRAMRDALSHRGAEHTGEYIGGGAALMYTGSANNTAQPLEVIHKERRVHIAVNGRLCNAGELRGELAAVRHRFSGGSDAEILARAYIEWGADCLSRVNGMFAAAIWDETERHLFLARDRMGAKPLFYTVNGGTLIFASEIPALLAHSDARPVLDSSGVAELLFLGPGRTPGCGVLRGIEELEPGTCAEYKDGRFHKQRYWRLADRECNDTFEQAAEKTRFLITDAIRRCTGGDTIGAFLSGGVDSSYVASLFSKHGGKKTFTVGFDYQRYNEITHAKNLTDSLGIENISKIISTEEYWDSLPSIQFYMDEPLADPAAVAFYFACREAAQHVTTAFSGEGADEFFGGYNIYKEPLSLKYYTWLPLRLRKWLALAAQKLPRNLKGRNYILRGAKPVEARFIGNAYIFTPEERDKLLKTKPIQSPMDITRPYYEQVKHEDDSTKMQFLDINLWLPEDILLQADKMSMAHGLKLRVPLMDKEVFKAASRLPVQYRVTKQETKVAFREAAARHLPPETAWRKKLGFPVPIRIWLREEDYYYRVRAYFVSEVAEEYFHVDALLALLDAHYDGQQDNSRKIWTIYMFLLWHDEFFGRSSGQ
ncbi:MAG: asparagine synthase (glutamine-hydrolyzing) [Defluviitaleaceae bacterium]|nr:asparagine synthase (glutamine-hydrolyzing) [Defluviitaleaceae bacterium]